MDTKIIINNMERKESDGFVTAVYFTVMAEEDGHQSSYGDFIMFNKYPDSLIPFESLTKDIVINWINEKVDMNQIELVLAMNIEKQKQIISGLPLNMELQNG